MPNTPRDGLDGLDGPDDIVTSSLTAVTITSLDPRKAHILILHPSDDRYTLNQQQLHRLQEQLAVFGVSCVISLPAGYTTDFVETPDKP